MKSKIQDGSFVRHRNGDIGLCINGNILDDYVGLSAFTEDLIHFDNRDMDIMNISRPFKLNMNCRDVEAQNNFFFNHSIWSREMKTIIPEKLEQIPVNQLFFEIQRMTKEVKKRLDLEDNKASK